MKTKVIFRRWSDAQGGDVIALFPELASNYGNPHQVESYMHVGQHGGADPAIVENTRLATPEEYAPLKAELERIGYVLRIAKKFTRADYEKRKAQLKQEIVVPYPCPKQPTPTRP